MKRIEALKRCHRLWWLSVVAVHWSTMVHLAVWTPVPGLLPGAAAGMRRMVDRERALAAEWSGITVEATPSAPIGQEKESRGLLARYRWLFGDAQRFREWRWTTMYSFVGGLIACVPGALVLFGLWGLFLAAFGPYLARDAGWDGLWYMFVPVRNLPTALMAGLLGLVVAKTGLWLAPGTVDRHARFVRATLAPSEQELMAARIAHLAATRSDAVDTSAAELRRIERDLHDGAQARLVAMGMTLDAAEHRLAEDPEAVRVLLAEARASSVAALQELRDLVRGIHPPVLADRGLADAVRSLALLSPLEAEVTVDLDGRPDAPVESAVYFAVAEAVTNAAKHGDAERLWIDIGYDTARSALRVSVTDDGRGGADPARGSGLTGIERRLATFDGVLAVNSPAGGPTQISLEVPCALSSPKTTSC
ncbi:histidine kinase [Streptomyces kunmingensis]|uniref:histidine kinase n=1 Tax=Streptomyces kunmingensis TaxID=68225 RepID=A0ABU6CEX4_9ACTN|nr:histidine kinase [Streptomyces kunmingensis]MEB3962420.1 histidine kinase [Streptomyces kunmingensis]